jgi:GGDEF domain-containing protein
MILQGTDYRERDQRASEFEVRRAAQCASTDVKWEQVSVSFGIAVYDPTSDESVGDVTRRADKLMYEAKRRRGAARLTNGQEAQPTSPDVDR